MTVFMQAIEKGALLPAHIAAGLWVDEDDHSLTLKHDTEEIAQWCIYANIWEIQAKATDWMERNKNVER